MLIQVENVKGELGGLPSYVGNGLFDVFVNYFPQFTGRTPNMALYRVLAMVRLILLGFPGLRMGRMNSRTLCSLGF